MAHGRNKYQSRENRARVRGVLMREWDPIGVAGVPDAADEYDAYSDKAYVMLMDDRATAEAIAAYVLSIATLGSRTLSGWSNAVIMRQVSCSQCARSSRHIRQTKTPPPCGSGVSYS